MKTDPGPRFCPRCGTALVAGLTFCPRCGFDSAEQADGFAAPGARSDPPVDALGRHLDPGSEAGSRPGASPSAPPRPVGGDSAAKPRPFVDRGSRGPAIIFGALIVAVGLVMFGLMMRPQPGASPAVVPEGAPSGSAGASSSGPPALIVGLTIQSPADGQSIATKDVTVIGLAPPGLTVTRDVSFGLDQHATADGTGHWAISVNLNDGQNDLVFRIGDDRSTEQRVRVIYTPPQAP